MKSLPVLMCLPLILTAGCGNGVSVCPTFPAPGPGVADEFAAPPAKPATGAWYQRLKRLDEQLEVCRGG
jgi:hypothetical protein